MVFAKASLPRALQQWQTTSRLECNFLFYTFSIYWANIFSLLHPVYCPLSEGFSDEDLSGEDLRPLLNSLRFFKAQYRHQDTPMDFHYEALRGLLSFHCDFVELPNSQSFNFSHHFILSHVCFILRSGARDSRKAAAFGIGLGRSDGVGSRRVPEGCWQEVPTWTGHQCSGGSVQPENHCEEMEDWREQEKDHSQSASVPCDSVEHPGYALWLAQACELRTGLGFHSVMP